MTRTAPSGGVPGFVSSPGLEFVSYHDVEGRPPFKLAPYEHDGRWYLYTGHIWHRGWSILDVTDPAAPELVAFVDGPENTWTLQVQAANGILMTALEAIGGPDLERATALWGLDPTAGNEEGVLFWDIRDPVRPTLLGRFATGGSGTHRNFFDGSDRAYLAANMAGYEGNIFVALDVRDPAAPVELGRWHVDGQQRTADHPVVEQHYLHGPPHPVGDRVYLPYGRAGFIILDVADPASPREVGRFDIGGFGSIIGAHTVLPIPERQLVVLTTEAIFEDGMDPMNLVLTVDVSDESAPRPLAQFPTPVPPPDLGVDDFTDLGGRFGPHNTHLPHGLPWLAPVTDRVHLTYENAGLWVYDIANPRLPRAVDWFIPDAPSTRRGLLPRTLVTQSEDVVVDRRGYVYLSDKNHGLFILRDRRMG